jgi:co-chaperonin GroES (HSP10)
MSEMIMAYRPTGNKVLIERVAAKKESAGGIILKSTEEPDKAKIVAIGPDVTDVAVGEVAIINWTRAVSVENDLYILPIDEVVMVIEEE